MRIQQILKAIVIPFIIFSFIILLIPLFSVIDDEGLSHSTYDWVVYGYSILEPYSKSNAEFKNGVVTLGNQSNNSDSWVIYKDFFLIEPFLDPTFKDRGIKARLEITTAPPTSSGIPLIFEPDSFWREDLSSMQWHPSGGEHIMKFNDDQLDLSANFKLGERSWYMWWPEEGSFPHINSTEYPTLSVRWKSTDHVARFVLYTDVQDEEFKVIIETPTGIIEAPATDYGGGYSPDWVTTLFTIPPNKTITSFDIGLDNGRWSNVDGEQHLEIDHIIFASSGINSSHAKIEFNGNLILDESLTYRINVSETEISDKVLYTWNPEVLWPAGKLIFTINDLKAENTIIFTAEEETQWTIQSIILYTNVNWQISPTTVERAPSESIVFFFLIILLVFFGIPELFYRVVKSNNKNPFEKSKTQEYRNSEQ